MTSERARLSAFSAAAAVVALAGCASAAHPAPAPEPAPSATLAAPAPPPFTPSRAAVCAVPAGEELVDVRGLDPTIRVDLRYATPHNFTGHRLPGYDAARALLHRDAAAALARVQADLRAQGLGLKIFDAYRPIHATLAMVDWAERSGNEWVLDQGYVARQSGHNRGNTVDLTLVDLASGRELEMGTAFDTFSEDAHTAHATGGVLENRMKLKRAMEGEGFKNYEKEWWHYSTGSQNPPLDVPLSCFH